MRLHLGCGNTRREGWLNVDRTEVEGVTDLVVDLDGPALAAALEPDSVDESAGVHLFEHLTRPLDFMAALWQVTKPGGRAMFELPYGTSDDAWEDPTHVRPYFMQSFDFFAQPAYWRADYGYTGDWRVLEVSLAVSQQRWAATSLDVIHQAVKRERNVVKAMVVALEAVKPARPRLAELREQTRVRIVLT